jgi:hypothetical protein
LTHYYFPWSIYDGVLAQVDLGTLGIVSKHSLVVLVFSLGMLGISLLAVALGVWLGLWWRVQTLSSAAAVMAILINVPLAYGVHRAVGVLHISDLFLRHLVQYALFAPLPYLLASGCMRLARRWARKW